MQTYKITCVNYVGELVVFQCEANDRTEAIWKALDPINKNVRAVEVEILETTLDTLS